MKFKYNLIACLLTMVTTNSFAIETFKKFKMVSNEGVRTVVVVDGQPFYQSTGRNSNQPATLFPFEKVTYIDQGNIKGVWIEKTSHSYVDNHHNNITETTMNIVTNNFINQLPDNFKKTVFKAKLNKIAELLPQCSHYKKWECAVSVDEDTSSLLFRLNSLNNARISYNFGAGFWSDGYELNQKERLLREALEYAIQKTGGVKGSYEFSSNKMTISYDLDRENYKSINKALLSSGAKTLSINDTK